MLEVWRKMPKPPFQPPPHDTDYDMLNIMMCGVNKSDDSLNRERIESTIDRMYDDRYVFLLEMGENSYL